MEAQRTRLMSQHADVVSETGKEVSEAALKL
jgi:hypothetical protein